MFTQMPGIVGTASRLWRGAQGMYAGVALSAAMHPMATLGVLGAAAYGLGTNRGRSAVGGAIKGGITGGLIGGAMGYLGKGGSTLGAIMGGRRFGKWGAIIGALGGFLGGDKINKNKAYGRIQGLY